MKRLQDKSSKCYQSKIIHSAKFIIQEWEWNRDFLDEQKQDNYYQQTFSKGTSERYIL